MRPTPIKRRALTTLLAGALLYLLLAPSAALASHSQVAMFEDDISLGVNPGATLQELRHLGVQVVRVGLHWSTVAPSPLSRRQPSFNATKPNAYPAANWSAYDTIVRDATADGLKVLFVPTAFAPLWAQGANPGRYGAHNNNTDQAFMPSASEFGQFMRAVGTRYSGSFKPPGAQTALPRVTYWELYNEPNFGEDLAPQAIDGSQILEAPILYRALLNAAWGALHATGHGGDTILIGALAARGAQMGPGPGRPQGLPGAYGETKPLDFTRALYCVDSNYRQYRGAAAAARSCPTTGAASARFRAQNPALFYASGVSDHPYPINAAPNAGDSTNPSYAQFNQLPNLAAALDRIQRAYHSGKRFPIWNTEYGYITCPPTCDKHHYVSPATAAYYSNWAEYLSWRSPRIMSTMQYLLYDPNPSVGTPEYGGFASALIFYPTVFGGGPKPTYFAYRLPIFLPVTSTNSGRTLEVWGDVRTAQFSAADGDGPQYVQIQFASGSSNSWSTLKTLKVTDPHGYFDTRVAFPSSGSVRIAWTYPPMDASLASTLVTAPTPTFGPGGYIEPLAPTTSRTVKITIT